MDYLKVFFFILLIFSVEKKVAAQGTATGCLLSDNKVYTSSSSLLGARLYDTSNSVSLSANYCTWTAPSRTSCNVCFGSINLLSLVCVGTVMSGDEGVFTMVECPLDDSAWSILLASGIAGLGIIRKSRS